MRYFLAPDGENEPTLWRTDEREPVAVIRRCELSPEGRKLWPLIVQAVTE